MRALEQEIERLNAECARSELADAVHGRRPTMYPLTREEKLERIEECEFPLEAPGELPEDLIEALELTQSEQVAYADALKVVSQHRMQVQNEVWGEVYGSDVPTYDELMQNGGPVAYLERVESLPRGPDDDDLPRTIAEEQAGLRQRPPDAALSPYARFVRAQKELPTRLHMELSQRIGDERTHEIRSFQGGWPGGFTMQAGCASKG